MNKILKIALSIALMGTFSFAKVYEDGEDGKTDRWQALGSGSISNIANEGNRVIQLSGKSRNEAFLLGGTHKFLNNSHKWDAREGSDVLATVASFTHTFTTLGEHNLTLFVTDDDGDVGSDSVMITVKNVVVATSKVKKTGQTTSYYPKDDGDYEKGVTLSYTRDEEKEIVTDNVTQLQWQDNIETQTVISDWEGAKDYCSALTLGGYSNWRLPTRKELFSIVDFGRFWPAMDPSKFRNIKSYCSYWSSTTHNS